MSGSWRQATTDARTRYAGSEGVARRVARVALWAAVGLVLVRGGGSIVSGADQPSRALKPSGGGGLEAGAFAVRFARGYLERAPQARQQLASGVGDRAAAALSLRGPGTRVAWAMVAREVSLGGSRVLITVACFLTDGRERYVTVPVSRASDGGLAVADLPSFSPPPTHAAIRAQEAEPLAGPHAGEVENLAARFLREYLSGEGPSALGYSLAPGVRLASMPRGLELEAVEEVGELAHPGDGPLTIGVLARVRDRSSQIVYPTRYRLRLVRRDRWYVAAVGGGPSA